jgi:microcystin-dependent protein
MQATEELADSPNPGGQIAARSTTVDLYINENPSSNLAATSITSTGGSQSHPNIMPFLCVHFIVALFGVYPSRN